MASTESRATYAADESTAPQLPGGSTCYLDRPGGQVGYEVAGAGALVVLVPGMGDLRAGYRYLAPALREVGYRVACTDLRGHGDSDATFTSYGDEDTANDVVALIEALGGPAVIVGNSMAAGSAVLVAAQRPELVGGLVLVGPFVRDPRVSAVQRVLLRAAMAPPWAAVSWKFYLPKLYAGRRPDDFVAYRDQAVASLRRPGYAKAFSVTTRTSHAAAENALPQVNAPTLVVMGERDPDFPDPKAEADWIGQALHATVVIVPDAGHYPQSQQPDTTTSVILSFLSTVSPRA
jgi:pimeloyl-ACP methyl ester carboxylesterase